MVTVSSVLSVRSQAVARRLQRIVSSSLSPGLNSYGRMGRHGGCSLQKAGEDDHTRYQVIGPRGQHTTVTLLSGPRTTLATEAIDIPMGQCVSRPSEKLLFAVDGD